jgi:hypothetical protein
MTTSGQPRATHASSIVHRDPIDDRRSTIDDRRRAYLGVAVFTYRAICAPVANQTPGLDFM